jgi:hypothetical protein
MTEPLITPKELAAALKVNVGLIYRMQKLGFCNNGKKHRIRATIEEARAWLENNPSPYSNESKRMLSNGK